MRFRVLVMPQAREEILGQARWILSESRTPTVAQRWMDGVYAGIETLQTEPRSHPVAEDDGRGGVEIRKLVMGGYTLLFTVLDDEGEVHVVDARGRGKLPRR